MAPPTDRCLLLVADGWYPARDGLYSVNRHLALSLGRFPGVRVYCALLTSLSQLSPDAVQDAEQHGVTLIGTDSRSADLYRDFNADPTSVFPHLLQTLPGVTHIVGHAPVTAAGALRLRSDLFTSSKVLLVYHVLPDETSWVQADLPYAAPSDTDLVRLAEQADVVYSVTEKLHCHFRAKFRNRASRSIDHRLLLPQSPEQMFDVRQDQPEPGARPVVLALCFGPPADWHGLDIAACAVNKAGLALMDRRDAAPAPRLVIGNVEPGHQAAVARRVAPHVTVADLAVEYHAYANLSDLRRDLRACTLAVVPCRAEPYGHLALTVISAGVPCLVSETCAVASLIKHLTPEPERLLVPVTPSSGAVRQDASVWRDRILRILGNVAGARDQTLQLRTALRRDEETKVSHDDVVCYCLGGIRLQHQVSSLTFRLEEDSELELPVLRALSQFVRESLRQCWRLKHHALTTEEDLVDLLPRVAVPHRRLVRLVTDTVEQHDRRIVGVDRRTGAFLVYCPTPLALCDLWSMCDVINAGLVAGLLSGDCGDVLAHFTLTDAKLTTSMSGPEYLAYKKELLKTARPKTAAF